MKFDTGNASTTYDRIIETENCPECGGGIDTNDGISYFCCNDKCDGCDGYGNIGIVVKE